MRIIHDVDCPMDPAAGLDNGRLKLFACSSSPKNHPHLIPQIFNDELIEIEGDPVYLVPLLESWLAATKSVMNHVEKQKCEST